MGQRQRIRARGVRAAVAALDPRVMLSTTTFSLAASVPQATNVVAVATADFNGDGKPDLVAIDGDQGRGVNSTVSVYLNDGAGGFGAAITTAAGVDAETLVVADLNGDGRPDVLTANVGSSDVSVLLGNGDGSFHAAASINVAANPRALAVADFDGDKVPDLAIAEEGDGDTHGDVVVLKGDGDGTFSDIGVQLTLTSFPESLVAGDFNSDGIVDLAASVLSDDQVTSSVDVLLNSGISTFDRTRGPELYGVPSAGIVADVNGDNIPDLAFATSAGVELLFGLADGTFTDDSLVTDTGAVAGIAAGDINGDGRLDLVSGSASGPMVGLSGSTDEFLKEQLVSGAAVGLSFAVADFNGDGAPDFAAASNISHVVQVFTSSTKDNPPPMTPTIGGLDPGFGNGSGQVVSTVPTADITSLDTAIVQQGELLSAGLDGDGNQVILTRYFTDGTVDKGFGGSRGVRTPLPAGFTATRVVFDQGTVTACVLGYVTASGQPALVRLTVGGYVDDSVGDDGVLSIPALRPGDQLDAITSVKNGYVLGGRALEAGAMSAVVLEVTAAGAITPKFGAKGVLVVPSTHGPVDAIESVAADAKGEIFATGSVSSGSASDGSLASSILTVKLSSAGKMDKGFGEKVLAVPGYALAAGQKVYVQADGKIVVSGDLAVSEAAAAQGLFGSVLVRYTSKGALDASFNGTGSFVVTAPPTNTVTASLVAASIQAMDSQGGSYGDFLSNRSAAASAVTGGKIREEAAQTSLGNTVITQSQIVADAADLKLTAVTLAGRSPYKAAKKATATVSLSDVGTLAFGAAEVPISLYLSANETLDAATDPAIPTGAVKLSLKPGQSKKQGVSFTMPGSYGGGPFYLFVVADADGSAIAELTLSDNTARTTGTFAISGAVSPATMGEQKPRARRSLFGRAPIL